MDTNPTTHATATRRKSAVNVFESLDLAETQRWLSDGTRVYFDPLWTAMHIGRTKDGVDFVHVADGMSLLITFKHLKRQELQPCAMPDWVHAFDHYPTSLMQRMVKEVQPVFVLEGIKITGGTEWTGRRFAYVTFGEDRHLLFREPEPFEHDEAAEREMQAVLAQEAERADRVPDGAPVLHC
jgi:hypothetical protein